MKPAARWGIALAGVALLGPHAARADSKAAEPLARLRESGRAVPTAMAQGLFTLPDLCDSDGNAYVAPAAKDDGDPDAVVRVSPDGQKSLRISLTSIPEFTTQDDPRVMALSLGVDDDLYVLAKGRQGPAYILAFARDGKYRSKTKLDVGPVAIRMLAPFPTGEFLVSGYRVHDHGPEPLFAILSGGGALLQSVHASEEAPGGASKAPAKPLAASAYLESAQVDRDGYAYVAQRGPEGPILQVSRYGEVVKRLVVEPPEREARLVRFKVSGRRLVVEHEGARGARKAPPRWLTVYDLPTEERLARYVVEGGSMLCYRSVSGLPDSFTLLTSDGKSLQLVQATGE